MGIPTILERCLQAQGQHAWEPSGEAPCEGSRSGVRPGRGCPEALATISHLAKPRHRQQWVVDADSTGAFASSDHAVLLRTLGDVPGKARVRQWRKAGGMDDGGRYAPTAGPPQGGVRSPWRLHVARHGLEAAVGGNQDSQGVMAGSRAVVRDADDVVGCCDSQAAARQVRASLLPCWLAARGVTLAAENTRSVHLTEGCDFLGGRVRHSVAPRTSRTGDQRLITPSPRAVAATQQAWRVIWRQRRGHARKNLLERRNPRIRGWANDDRPGVASRPCSTRDQGRHRRVVQQVRRQHRNTPWRWCKQRSGGHLHPESNDAWVCGEQPTGRYLLKGKWLKIVRPRVGRGTASPDEPRLRGYGQARRREERRDLRRSDVKLAYAQDWRGPVCGMDRMHGEARHCHHRQAKADGGADADQHLALVHLYCHQQQTRQWQRTRQATQEQLGKCRT